MKFSRIILLLLILALVLAGCGSTKEDDTVITTAPQVTVTESTGLTGTWQGTFTGKELGFSDDVSELDVFIQLILNEDGTFSASSTPTDRTTSSREGSYTVQENTMTFNYSSDNPEDMDVYTYDLDEDTLTLVFEENQIALSRAS